MFHTEIVFPDYNNSILNLISSIGGIYGVDLPHKPLSWINSKKLISRNNIILIILDGMGYNLFNRVSKKNNIKWDNVHKLTSVFPPTTASAITSIMTGRSPLEHGVIGWSLYFKEFGKMIDVLPKIESSTGEALGKSYDLNAILNIGSIFNKIHLHAPSVELIKITPEYIAGSDFSIATSSPAEIISYKKMSEMFSTIAEAAVEKNGKKLIVSYSVNPDGLEHLNGVYTDTVLNHMVKAFNEIKKLADLLRGKNSTIFITADHGLIDIKRYIYIDEDQDLMDTLIVPIFPEPRFCTFFVKPGRENNFLKAISKYQDDFLIMSREEFLNRKLLGTGKPHKKTDDFLGNYVAIAKSKSVFKMRYKQDLRKSIKFKAHHAGLTSDEMYVPLIEIDSE